MTEVRKRQLAWVAGISAVIALLAVWTFAIEWEWSYIGDDASWVAKAREASSGNFLSWWTYLGSLITGDTFGWGLFRPFYQFSSLLVYQLPTGPAHGLRLAVYLLLLATPILIVIKGTRPGRFRLLAITWVSALFLAGYTIIYGVYFVSLQEFTGMALVASGLLTTNSYLRGFLWLLAGWTKAPFIWLAIAFGVQKTFVPPRRIGLLILALGITSLAFMVFGAQTGSYTSERLNLNPWHLWGNIQSLGTYGALFLMILVVGLFMFSAHIQLSPESLVLLFAAFMYAANLLPWNTIGYYNAPVWFLMTCAVATAIKPLSKEAQPQISRWAVPVITGCLAASALLAAETFRTDVFGRNQMVVEARDWYLSQRSVGTRLLMGNINPADFNFILTEHDPRFRGSLDSYVDETTGFVLVMNDWSYPPEIDECPPIKVWTRGFLAPLKC